MKESISNFYKRMPIKAKWFIFVCLLLIYPMFFIGYIGYKNYEGVIKEHFASSVQKEVKMTSQQIKDQLANMEEFVGKLRYDEQIYTFTRNYYKLIYNINTPSEEYIITKHQPIESIKQQPIVMSDYDLARSIKNYLYSVMLSRPDICLAAYQFAEQQDTGYVVSKAKSYYEEKDFMDQNIFGEITKAFDKVKGEKDDKTVYYVDNKGHMYIARKLFDKYTCNESGIIIFKLGNEYILNNYKKMVEGSKEAVYIIANGSISMGEFGNIVEGNKKKLEAFIAMNPPADVIYSQKNSKQIILYDLIVSKNLNLASAVFISTDILLQDVRAMSRFIFLLCIGTVPLFVLLANKLYKEVIHPVYLLSDKMHQIEKGEMGVEIKNTRKDEMGYVFTAFNKMSKQLEYLVNCVYREQLALKNSELKALQAQINPHFLYNTLEMINWKARMSGNEDLCEMIEALSGIMEINIDRRNSPFITLKEEVGYLKHYMFLIEKRFGPKIKFKIETNQTLLTYKIPRLLLQPLIENAITHGIEPVGKGSVTVNIEEQDSKLKIIILDTGQGIEEAALKKLTTQLNTLDKNYLEKEADTRGHIGVANVQKRIQLLYGRVYGMEIKSIWQEKTQIEITLPLTLTGEIENQ